MVTKRERDRDPDYEIQKQERDYRDHYVRE